MHFSRPWSKLSNLFEDWSPRSRIWSDVRIETFRTSLDLTCVASICWSRQVSPAASNSLTDLWIFSNISSTLVFLPIEFFFSSLNSFERTVNVCRWTWDKRRTQVQKPVLRWGKRSLGRERYQDRKQVASGCLAQRLSMTLPLLLCSLCPCLSCHPPLQGYKMGTPSFNLQKHIHFKIVEGDKTMSNSFSIASTMLTYKLPAVSQTCASVWKLLRFKVALHLVCWISENPSIIFCLLSACRCASLTNT